MTQSCLAGWFWFRPLQPAASFLFAIRPSEPSVQTMSDRTNFVLFVTHRPDSAVRTGRSERSAVTSFLTSPVKPVSYPYDLETGIPKYSCLWDSLFWCAMTNLSILKLLKQILSPFCFHFVSVCFQKIGFVSEIVSLISHRFNRKIGRLETKSP